MKRRVLLIPVLMLLAVSAAWAQGLETFDNHTITGTSYVSGNFVGNNGITWNYYFVTGEQTYPIEGKGILLRRSEYPSKVYSGTISGGIGDFSLDMRKAFTSWGDRQIALYVNDVHIADSKIFGGASGAQDSIHVFSVEGVNIPGDIVIEIRHITGNDQNRQLVIDNVSWTGYTGAAVDYPPVARAGNDQFALFGDTITLNGSASSDRNNDIESYLWTQVGGTSATLNNPDSVITTFTAPSENTILSFELLVTDSTGLSDRDTVYVTVRENIINTVFFSEYIEGSSNNKALEIYNGSGGTVSLDDFRIAQSNDGGGWQYYHYFPDGATLANEDVWVILNENTSTSLFNHSYADEVLPYPSVVHHNGNDARGLEWTPDGGVTWVLVDIIGDPNSAADFDVAGVTGAGKDHTLIRKPYVDKGNPDWPSSAGTNEDNSEWIVMDVDYFGDLGSHTAGPQAYAFSNVALNTDFPRSGSEIGVSIDITPGDAIPVPASVKLYYGTGGTLANSTDMWVESGNTWAGTIPSLSDGNLVLEYYVEAKKDANMGKSATYNTLVAGAVSQISDIHDDLASVEGELKTLEGVITIGSNLLTNSFTSAYMQDESGRGLNIYRSGTPVLEDLERGTKIRIVGEIETYNTTVEITGFKYQIIATDQPLPAAQAVSVAGANSDDLEGTLATITGELARIDTFSTSKNLILSDGSAETVIKVYNTTGIDLDVLSMGTEYAITGVGSRFSAEHQLLVAYQSDITDEVSICDKDGLPVGFALNNAYPNPFNPATTIEYTLDQAGSYELSIYNLTGQRVAVLAGGHAEPGMYKQTWNAAAFTSGIYFIRLEAADKVATRKLVLIK